MVISGKDQQTALKIKHQNMEKRGKKQHKAQIERKQKSLKKKETTEGKQRERKMAKKSVEKEMYESMRVAMMKMKRKLNVKKKKSEFKVEEDEDTGGACGDGRASQCEYRWKRRIPASR